MLLNFKCVQLCDASVPDDVQLVPGGCVHGDEVPLQLPHLSHHGQHLPPAPSPQVDSFFFTSFLSSSVPDPDPYFFGPPGSGSTSQRYGSGSLCHQAKIVRKNLDSYCFVTSSGSICFWASRILIH
jgi:hypothetical protein